MVYLAICAGFLAAVCSYVSTMLASKKRLFVTNYKIYDKFRCNRYDYSNSDDAS